MIELLEFLSRNKILHKLPVLIQDESLNRLFIAYGQLPYMARNLMVSNLRSVTKDSRLESGC